jgi:hypothetical protein
MKELMLERCWCIFEGGFIGAKDGEPATAENLVTFEEASQALSWHHRGEYPPTTSMALSLDASGCMSISLLNCWSEDTGLVEGASMVASALDSYTEKCHRGPDGVSVRILCRGRVPEGVVVPPRVQIVTTGFVTLTGQRISPHPPWRKDNGETVTDATTALNYLFVSKRPRYVYMG